MGEADGKEGETGGVGGKGLGWRRMGGRRRNHRVKGEGG